MIQSRGYIRRLGKSNVLPADYENFADEMTLLAERLPRRLSQNLVDAYFASLAKFSFVSVKSALRYWPEMRTTFPREAELKEFLKGRQTKVTPVRHNGELEKKYWKLDNEYWFALQAKNLDEIKRIGAELGSLTLELGYQPVKQGEAAVTSPGPKYAEVRQFVKSFGGKR